MTPRRPGRLAAGDLSSGCVLACENNHAIKMKQGVGDDHGRGSARYTQPLFSHATDCAPRGVLSSSLPCFIASISHTGNSLGTDKCAALKPLNGQQRKGTTLLVCT